MFNTLIGLAMLAMTAVAAVGGFMFARDFVRRRLRFVDAVHSPFFPAIIGVIAFLVASPVALLPFVGLGIPAVFAIGSALGTVSGVRAIGRAEHSRGRLMP